jgi:chromosome segregation ATPase
LQVSAASKDRTSDQDPLIGPSAHAPILMSEQQNALLETQRLAAEIVPKESVSRSALQDLERSESRRLERENARLVRELDGLGARQSEQAEKLAVFQAQMREHMGKVLAAERSLEGFRQGSGEGGVEKLLERVKGLEAENAFKQERVEELQRKFLGGEGEKEALRERAAGLQSEVEALRAEIERQGGEADRWGEMRKDLEAALSRARAVQDELKKERTEGGALRREIGGLRTQVGVLEESLKKERARGLALRQEVGGLRTQVGVLEETLRAVENERDRGVKDAEERERVLRGGEAKRQERVVVLQRDLAEAQEEIQSGERKLLASARKEAQMRVELHEAKERHAELAARFEGWERVKGSLEGQLKAARVAEARAVLKVEKQERHVAELTGRLGEVEASAREGKEAANEMRKRFEGLEGSMRAEIEAGRARVLELERECEQARAATEEADKRAEGLVISVQEREERRVAEIEELQESERALQAEVSAALAERDRWKSEAEGLGVLVTEARAEIERLTAEGAETLLRVERLQESERTARENLVVAMEDVEEGRVREQGLEERLSDVAGGVQRSEEEARDRLLEKEVEIEELKRSQKEASKELEDAREKIGELQQSRVEAQKRLEEGATALKSAEERVRSAEAKTSVLENRAVALKERLRECESAKVDLEERLEELKIDRSAKVVEAEGRVGALIERLGEAERELSECREKLRMAGEESVALEEYCGTLNAQLAAKDGELERLVQVCERKREEDLAEATRAEQARVHKDVAERVRGLESALARANEELLEERGKMGESERLRDEIDRLMGSLQKEQRECGNLRDKVAELEQEVLEKDGQLGIIRTQGDMDYYITPQKERHRGRF